MRPSQPHPSQPHPSQPLATGPPAVQLSEELRILALQPFAGGSHAAMLDGWRRYSRHGWTVLELPAVHWKWRMRHGPLTLAAEANRLSQEGAAFDLVFCTEMLPLHEWRGLVGPPLAQLPAVVYFHENQLTYPTRAEATPDLHYGYTNLLTLLSGDEVWFNSEFHRSEFQRAALELLARMPDHRHVAEVRAAFASATICPPGIELPKPSGAARTGAARTGAARTGAEPGQGKPSSTRPLRIGWVGRWEHDKRPERFVAALDRLAEQRLAFELVLLGQRFRSEPEALRELRERHGSRIAFDGYAESRQDYWNRLSEIDVVVSTADHEFFGIGIAEAVAAGAVPLVPERLSYPELLGYGEHLELAKCFYDGTSQGLAARLAAWIAERDAEAHPAGNGGGDAEQVRWSASGSLREYLGRRMRNLSWERAAAAYDRRLHQCAVRQATL